MSDPERTDMRRAPDTEMKVAAAAITAAISPPLGVAVAAGSALRSARVREVLRKSTVQALAGALELGDKLTAAAQRGNPPGASVSETPASEPQPNGSSTTPKSKH